MSNYHDPLGRRRSSVEIQDHIPFEFRTRFLQPSVGNLSRGQASLNEVMRYCDMPLSNVDLQYLRFMIQRGIPPSMESGNRDIILNRAGNIVFRACNGLWNVIDTKLVDSIETVHKPQSIYGEVWDRTGNEFPLR